MIDRLKEFKKHVSAYNGVPCSDVRNQIISYLQEIDWTILEDKTINHGFMITAETSERSALVLLNTGMPQIVSWTIIQEEGRTILKSTFEFVPRFTRAIDTIFFLFILVPIISVVLKGSLPDFPTHFVALIIAPYLVSAAFYLYTLNRTFASHEYDRFLNELYARIFRTLKTKVEIIRYPIFLKGTRILVCYGLLLILPLLVSAPKEFRQIPLVPTVFLVSSITFMTFSGLLTLKRDVHSARRWLNHLPFLMTGFLFFCYLLIPLFLVDIRSTIPSSIEEQRLIGFSLLILVLLAIIGLAFFLPGDIEHGIKYKHIKNKKLEPISNMMFDKSIILVTWTFLSLINMSAVYFTFAASEYALTGSSKISGSLMIETLGVLYGRIGVSLYYLPILALFVVLIARRVKDIKNVRTALRPPNKVESEVRSICSETGVKSPILILGKSHSSWLNVSYIMTIGHVLEIGHKALDILTEDECRAVFAHEVWHIKEHTKRFFFLDILSEFTLFGKGFLSVTQDTREFEFSADRFAVDFLKRRNLDKNLLISAIEKLTISDQREIMVGRSLSRQGFREQNAPKEGKRLNLQEKFKWLYDVYFGDRVVSYFHPSIDERILRIEAME